MCSPALSFLIDNTKKIFYKDGIQSHSELATHFGLDEDKLLKVDYDWTTKTIDIYGENKFQNETCAFIPKISHYKAIDSFINEKVGTKQRLKHWLKLNWDDYKIREKSIDILNNEGQGWLMAKAKTFKMRKKDFITLIRLFERFPNKIYVTSTPD